MQVSVKKEAVPNGSSIKVENWMQLGIIDHTTVPNVLPVVPIQFRDRLSAMAALCGATTPTGPAGPSVDTTLEQKNRAE